MKANASTSTGKTIYRSCVTAVLVTLVTAFVGTAHAKTAPTPSATAGGACVIANDEAVAELFRKWNLALASLDSAKVAALYWPNAVLLPTVSNVPRTDTASITDYFDHFLKKFPRGAIVRRFTHHACNVSIDDGLYDFSVMDPAGNASTVSARYTFVYTYRDGEWKIQHHHSSAMPEPVGVASKSTHEEPAHATDAHENSDTHTPSASAEKKRPAVAESTGERLRIQLESATRTPSSYLSPEQRRKVGRETVGLKVCANSRDGERSFTVSDAAPHHEANEAAVAWAKASRWSVSGAPSEEKPACAQVVVRFTDAGV